MYRKNLVSRVALSFATLCAAASLFVTPAMAADSLSVELPAVQRHGAPSLKVGYEWELPAVQRPHTLLLPAVQAAREAASK